MLSNQRRSTLNPLNPLNSQKELRHLLSAFCGFCVERCVGWSWFTEYRPLAWADETSTRQMDVAVVAAGHRRGQAHGELRAETEPLARRRDRAPMRLDHVAHDRQPQSEAAVTAGHRTVTLFE